MTALTHGNRVPTPHGGRHTPTEGSVARPSERVVGVVDHFIDLRDGALTRSSVDLRTLDADALVPPARWRRWYVAVLLVLDAGALLVGAVLAMQVRFGDLDARVDGVSYLSLSTVSVVPWLATIAACRGYESRFFGAGSEEFRRVGDGAVRFTALVAVLAFAGNVSLARGMVALALPTASVTCLVGRYAARRVLGRVRSRGTAGHRVIVVGDGPAASTLVQRLERSPHAGLRVVGTCAPTGRRSASGEDSGLTHVRRLVRELHADTVAVAHSPGVTTDSLRRMAWALEGAGVDLLVAPAFTDVAGPRIHVRPVSGLPLLQIAAPDFSGARRLLKRTLDVLGTLALLLLLLPVLLVVALLVRVTSPGPVLFRQVRVGRGGRLFTLYKFRSMEADAEARLVDLLPQNDSDGVLFKMDADPRVTALGRWLRRTSLDELPQLVNVLFGQMSLVGPRPPLPSEVARYDGDVHRRLLVTPGITGLWQVSGRSDLKWTEAVRLDLYYVENWSVALDCEILWKTLFAVVRGCGAR